MHVTCCVCIDCKLMRMVIVIFTLSSLLQWILFVLYYCLFIYTQCNIYIFDFDQQKQVLSVV